MFGSLLTTPLFTHPRRLENENKPLRYLMENVAPNGALPGTIAAGTSKLTPDYWYHWTRDAALTMDVLLLQYKKNDKETKSSLLPLFHDYLFFSARQQITKALTGLGEPKFHLNGLAFNKPWGRPQNDGPALRALTLTRIATQLLKEERLFSEGHNYETVIKSDLNYTVMNWKEPSFDLWEEVCGEHFYTKMVERKALLEGASFVESLGEKTLAKTYRKEALCLEDSILTHFQKDRIIPTQNRKRGLDWKNEGLDSSIILAVLHTQDPTFVSLTNDYVVNTAYLLKNRFKNLYPINQNFSKGGAIGRYPEDRYDGVGLSTGHPWYLLTFAFSEYFSLLAKTYESAHEIQITPITLSFFHELCPLVTSNQEISEKNPLFHTLIYNLNHLSYDFYESAMTYVTKEGRISEQFDRNTGQMRGAENLTWSYANQLRALWALEAP